MDPKNILGGGHRGPMNFEAFHMIFEHGATPQKSFIFGIFHWETIRNHWGYPHLWKPPYFIEGCVPSASSLEASDLKRWWAAHPSTYFATGREEVPKCLGNFLGKAWQFFDDDNYTNI
jgi:hypothetical protein